MPGGEERDLACWCATRGSHQGKAPKEESCPPDLCYVGLFTLAVLRGAQGAAPLWKANQPIEQGVVMEGGNSGSLEERLSLDPVIFATVFCFPPSLGVVFT